VAIQSLSDFEQDVVRALAGGDHALAATHTLRRLGPEILAFLLGRLRDETLASEAFSMFAEDLWRTMPDLELTVGMRAYAFAIARNAAFRLLDRRVRPDRRNIGLTAAGVWSEVAEQVQSATLAYLRTDTKDAFAQLRQQLSEEEQTLLTLRVDRQLAWSEIAQVFAGLEPLSEEEAKRASARLRKRFEATKNKLRNLAVEAGLLDC
jgi:RNA polymerase sigma-70 factor, ECF subfamily